MRGIRCGGASAPGDLGARDRLHRRAAAFGLDARRRDPRLAPDVAAGGELGALSLVLETESRERGVAIDVWAPHTTAEDWDAPRPRLSRAHGLVARERPRSTDKRPGNWRYIGAIRRMLPGARIVVCRRDPVENALGCFVRLFAPRTQRFSYDLDDIASYWQRFSTPPSAHVLARDAQRAARTARRNPRRRCRSARFARCSISRAFVRSGVPATSARADARSGRRAPSRCAAPSRRNAACRVLSCPHRSAAARVERVGRLIPSARISDMNAYRTLSAGLLLTLPFAAFATDPASTAPAIAQKLLARDHRVAARPAPASRAQQPRGAHVEVRRGRAQEARLRSAHRHRAHGCHRRAQGRQARAQARDPRRHGRAAGHRGSRSAVRVEGEGRIHRQDGRRHARVRARCAHGDDARRRRGAVEDEGRSATARSCSCSSRPRKARRRARKAARH